MRELEQIREELDRTRDYELASERAVLAQRRERKEVEAMHAEQRNNSAAIPPSMKGR